MGCGRPLIGPWAGVGVSAPGGAWALISSPPICAYGIAGFGLSVSAPAIRDYRMGRREKSVVDPDDTDPTSPGKRMYSSPAIGTLPETATPGSWSPRRVHPVHTTGHICLLTALLATAGCRGDAPTTPEAVEAVRRTGPPRPPVEPPSPPPPRAAVGGYWSVTTATRLRLSDATIAAAPPIRALRETAGNCRSSWATIRSTPIRSAHLPSTRYLMALI